MRPSWPRVEQRQRKEAPLETANCTHASRQDCTETYASHCRCSDNDVGSVFPVERFSGTRHCGWRRVGDSARHLQPGRTRAGRSMWLPGSSGGLCSDGVQECFVGHEKRHTNIHGGQRSGLSSKTCKRLFPCGRCGCFRWFSTDNAERITTDWRWERYEHWHEQPGRKRTWSWTRKGEAPSRFSTPITSQIQSDINRNCEGRTGTWNSNSTRSVFTLSSNGTSGQGLSESWDA